MSLTARDRKIVLVLLPVIALAGYWFLVLGPKRGEAADLGQKLTEAESRRDEAQARATELESAKGSYAKDYETVVRLGKAIPSTVDMPTLIVQLDDAAKGTGIKFKKVTAGDRNAAPAPPAPPPTQGGQGGDAAAGGQQASTTGGKATEKANEAAQTSDNANAAAGADAGSASGAAGGTTSGVAGLDSIPLDFAFSGSFFDLADFFHRMKRFVRVADKNISVQGRLMTIDTLNFKSDTFPVINAEVKATVYLSPKAEGTTAGASPAGPGTTTPAGTQPAPAPTPASTSSSGAPVAQTGDAR